MERCPCGQPLHYTNDKVQHYIQDLIDILGSTVDVTVNGRTWAVPRHYIALHGINGSELARTAQQLGFIEVT